MYNKEKALDAIECAEENMKIAKEQIKRIDKIEMLSAEISVNNRFGYEQLNSISCTFNMRDHFEGIIKQSAQNIKRYKKILKAIDYLGSFDAVEDSKCDEVGA